MIARQSMRPWKVFLERCSLALHVAAKSFYLRLLKKSLRVVAALARVARLLVNSHNWLVAIKKIPKGSFLLPS